MKLNILTRKTLGGFETDLSARVFGDNGGIRRTNACGPAAPPAAAIATAFGAQRFHLVGHDWGGQLAWLIGAAEPERVRSLTVLSRSHPAAFAAALKNDAAQSERSRHHRAFTDPDAAAKLLADDAKRLRRALSSQGVSDVDIAAYLGKLEAPAALDAALNWYRAAQSGGKGLAVPAPSVRVPTCTSG